jgi:hypothetical protein
MDINPQLHPLEVNRKTGEPFLRLLSHTNIIITPPRLSDAPLYVPILNDERVIRWLSSPPYPYLLGKLGCFYEISAVLKYPPTEHGEWWVNQAKPQSDKLLTELEDAQRPDAQDRRRVSRGEHPRSQRRRDRYFLGEHRHHFGAAALGA